MEEFVQSSGDAGIMVFTLGSMVKKVTKEKGNIIASAFLLTITLLLVFLFTKTCCYCLQKCCDRKREVKKKAE